MANNKSIKITESFVLNDDAIFALFNDPDWENAVVDAAVYCAEHCKLSIEKKKELIAQIVHYNVQKRFDEYLKANKNKLKLPTELDYSDIELSTVEIKQIALHIEDIIYTYELLKASNNITKTLRLKIKTGNNIELRTKLEQILQDQKEEYLDLNIEYKTTNDILKLTIN